MVALDNLIIERVPFLLKGQRLGYRFSQKYGNNLTYLLSLSSFGCPIYFSGSAFMPP